MKFNRKIIFIHSIFFFTFLISGCASLVKLVAGKNGLEIPQIVAHLEGSNHGCDSPNLGNSSILSQKEFVLKCLSTS